MGTDSAIVITGMGVVSAIGVGREETLRSLQSGTTGIGRLRFLQTLHKEFPCGEVPLSNGEMAAKLHCEPEAGISRTVLLGRMALQEAIGSAMLGVEGLEQAHFISATTVGGMDRRELFYADEARCDSRHAAIAAHNCATCTHLIALPSGGFASQSTVSTACSSAANAIMSGADKLLCGMAEIVIAGGAEALSKFHLNGFNALMILDRSQCRPFDKYRAGLNLGEGAAYIVMETERSARKRGAKPLCRLAGYGNACDAFHQTASSPDGEGAFLAMGKALDMAGLRPQDIDYMNAHGTGTPNNDESESRAIMRLFGGNVPPVSSTKSFTGHTTSASGSIEAVISILALQRQFLPVNLNWHERMDGGITPVMAPTPSKEIVNVQSNAFGFGGNDSSLIFSKI